MADYADLWYAAKETQIVYSPPKVLETFGETSVRYFMLTEMLDDVDRVRIREGKVTAARPKVITPTYFVNQALENFGEEARQYVEGLLKSQDGVRIIEYGLHFRKEEYNEEIVGGNLQELADKVTADAKSQQSDLCGVVIGVDDRWEISLLAFINGIVRRSLPQNAREMASRGLLGLSGHNVPNAVRIELESDFREAWGHLDRAKALGEKLRKYGVFDEYEDRFYDLFKACVDR